MNDATRSAGLGQPQRVAGRGDAVDDARVELADRDRAGDLVARAHAHGDRQRGRDQLGGERRRQRRRADPQPLRRAGGHPRDVGAGGVEPQQDRLGVLEQPRARLGRRDRAARSSTAPRSASSTAMCWETADCV